MWEGLTDPSTDFTVAFTHCSADALNPCSKTFHSAENSKALLSQHLKSLNNWVEVTCGGQPPGEQKVNFKETKKMSNESITLSNQEDKFSLFSHFCFSGPGQKYQNINL